MSGDIEYPSDLNTPPTALEIIEFSEHCWYWWLSRDDWINRKVLQLTHIDRETFEAETTYDINFSRVQQISEQFSTNTTDRILLPLDMLQQRPYMTTGADKRVWLLVKRNPDSQRCSFLDYSRSLTTFLSMRLMTISSIRSISACLIVRATT